MSLIKTVMALLVITQIISSEMQTFKSLIEISHEDKDECPIARTIKHLRCITDNFVCENSVYKQFLGKEDYSTLETLEIELSKQSFNVCSQTYYLINLQFAGHKASLFDAVYNFYKSPTPTNFKNIIDVLECLIKKVLEILSKKTFQNVLSVTTY